VQAYRSARRRHRIKKALAKMDEMASEASVTDDSTEIGAEDGENVHPLRRS
jgi:hypothetical protein